MTGNTLYGDSVFVLVVYMAALFLLASNNIKISARLEAKFICDTHI